MPHPEQRDTLYTIYVQRGTTTPTMYKNVTTWTKALKVCERLVRTHPTWSVGIAWFDSKGQVARHIYASR
jgi:hypothetical protein